MIAQEYINKVAKFDKDMSPSGRSFLHDMLIDYITSTTKPFSDFEDLIGDIAGTKDSYIVNELVYLISSQELYEVVSIQ